MACLSLARILGVMWSTLWGTVSYRREGSSNWVVRGRERMRGASEVRSSSSGASERVSSRGRACVPSMRVLEPGVDSPYASSRPPLVVEGRRALSKTSRGQGHARIR